MKEIIYNGAFTAEQQNIVRQISLECGILEQTAGLLFSRGADTVEKAKAFFRCGKDNFYSPFLLDGMKEAAERIEVAKTSGQTVLIFGDYDADGICATTILYFALQEYGIEALKVVPDRENGYGINKEIIQKYNDEYGIDLLISVDCGVSNVLEVEFAKTLGIDVIVTDHHEPPETLPDCIIVNPKKPTCGYPFKGLCGAGVTFKLATALIGEKAEKYLDFTALATVADSMELTGENRDIVVEGLKIFNSSLRPAFKDLLGNNSGKAVTAQTLAYGLAPRVNACGRMGDASAALKLFTTESATEIFDYSVKLNRYNIERQAECDALYRSAKELLAKKGASKNIIMIYDTQWKTGFVGIVAAKLAEEYARPVIIFAGLDGILKGSARSIDGINIFEAVLSVKDLLLEFGGHSQAAGLAVKEENFSELENRLDEYIAAHYEEKTFIPRIYAESEISGRFSLEFARELEMLEPYGVGNRRPLFVTEIGGAKPTLLKADSAHLAFKTGAMEMLYFNGLQTAEILSIPLRKKVVFEANLSVFRKKESLKGFVREIVTLYNGEDLSLYAFEKQIQTLKNARGGEPTPITEEQFQQMAQSKQCRYGTAYLLCSPDNLWAYPLLKDVQVSVFYPSEKNLLNTVIIAPKPDINLNGFERILYLDVPLKYIVPPENSQLLTLSLEGRKNAENLEITREVFGKYFFKIKNECDNIYVGSADFYYSHGGDLNPFQYVFCLETFLELGIFYIKNGVLKHAPEIKADLTCSAIYSGIKNIKE